MRKQSVIAISKLLRICCGGKCKRQEEGIGNLLLEGHPRLPASVPPERSLAKTHSCLCPLRMCQEASLFSRCSGEMKEGVSWEAGLLEDGLEEGFTGLFPGDLKT